MEKEMKSYSQEEFNRMVNDNDLEVFTADQLQSFAKQADAEILKSEGSKEEIMKAVADEIRTFTPTKVWGLNKYQQLDSNIMFIRPQQVEWEPVEGDEIEKSRGGVYKDTSENRKLGRVGKKFGGVKVDEFEEKDLDIRAGSLHITSKEGGGISASMEIDGKRVTKDLPKELTPKNSSDYENSLNKIREFLSKNEEQPKGEEKKEGKEKTNSLKVDVESVKDWVGDEFSSEDILDISNTLYEEGDVEPSYLKVDSKHRSSQEKFSDAINDKVTELYEEVREGMWSSKFSKQNIRDVIWGIVMSKNQ